MEKTKKNGVESVKAEIVEEKADVTDIIGSVKDMLEKASAPLVAYFDNNKAYTQSETGSFDKEIDIEMGRLENGNLTEEERIAAQKRIDDLRTGKSQAVRNGREHDLKGMKIAVGAIGTVAVLGIAVFDKKLASQVAGKFLPKVAKGLTSAA